MNWPPDDCGIISGFLSSTSILKSTAIQTSADALLSWTGLGNALSASEACKFPLELRFLIRIEFVDDLEHWILNIDATMHATVSADITVPIITPMVVVTWKFLCCISVKSYTIYKSAKIKCNIISFDRDISKFF